MEPYLDFKRKCQIRMHRHGAVPMIAGCENTRGSQNSVYNMVLFMPTERCSKSSVRADSYNNSRHR